jgi:hypothetical protein
MGQGASKLLPSILRFGKNSSDDYETLKKQEEKSIKKKALAELTKAWVRRENENLLTGKRSS